MSLLLLAGALLWSIELRRIQAVRWRTYHVVMGLMIMRLITRSWDVVVSVVLADPGTEAVSG